MDKASLVEPVTLQEECLQAPREREQECLREGWEDGSGHNMEKG